MNPLELIFRYRVLLGKCESGAGLDLDEIETLTMIEAHFAPSRDERSYGRRFRREAVTFAGMLRHHDISDCIVVSELSPGGLVCRSAPYLDEGQLVEVVVEASPEYSYRFKGKVQWLRDDADDDFQVGLALVGTPVRLHHGPVPQNGNDPVDQIAA